MDVRSINAALQGGSLSVPGLFPRLEELQKQPFNFGFDFGLAALPREPGVLIIRGPRQYGKSTWLEMQIRDTIQTHGPGSAFFLDGDEIAGSTELIREIRNLLPLFARNVPVRRLFIDEITAVSQWVKGLKILLDRGELGDVLVVTTGSSAIDLHKGTERLPGRKGRLDRSTYLFTPISYREFKRACQDTLQDRTLTAYLMSGGSPLAGNELAENQKLPEFVMELIRDWIYGACTAANRSRPTLQALIEVLFRYGGNTVSQAKVARESGMANNTMALGYLEFLTDLLCLAPAYFHDTHLNRKLRRKEVKYHFTNLLVATVFHPARPRTLVDFGTSLSPALAGMWWEWAVAAELWRRAAIRGEEQPELLGYWRSQEHEIDFIDSSGEFIEVKHGQAFPMDFGWFHQVHPRGHLTVIGENRFETADMIGLTLEDFLLQS